MSRMNERLRLVLRSFVWGSLIWWLLPRLGMSAGVAVVAGGGYEGDRGDTTAWSYELYRALLSAGDVDGDGRVTVAVLSSAEETNWLPSYFEWLGADEAFNLRVSTRAEADDPRVVGVLETADAVFIKGGDQGVYYDEWNDTLLETQLRVLVDVRGGGIGGTSAGAMSLAEYCFAPGKDLVSLDVLTDARTNYLNDSDGGSGVHTDFLGFLRNVLLDTHYTTRARLGRMLGILAKAVEENADAGILAVGIEERTGLVIQGTRARVIGVGSVDFIVQTPDTVVRRDARRPLFYTNLRLDRLTEGWVYDLAARQVDLTSVPTTAVPVGYEGDPAPRKGPLTIHGNDPADEDGFVHTVDVAPRPYATHDGGSRGDCLVESLGILDAQDEDRRGSVQESIFRALYDFPASSAFLVADSGQLRRGVCGADLVRFQANTQVAYPEAATIVIDGKSMTYKDLSPRYSNLDTGSHTLRAAALVNLRVHVLAESATRRVAYDVVKHQVVGD